MAVRRSVAEAVGFEPTGRFLADQTISSRSRYGHFDTLPQNIATTASGNWRELLERTKVFGCQIKASKPLKHRGF